MSKNSNSLRSVIVILITFSLGWYSSKYYFDNFGKPLITINQSSGNTEIKADSSTQSVSQQKSLQNFWEVWSLLDEKYYDVNVLDNQKRIYGAIKGMVKSADDAYTVFLDPKETTDFEMSLAGELEGIGAELSIDNGNLIVISPLKGSPAEKAGLKPKDVIYQINGKISSEMTLYDAIMQIRGKAGTSVKLTILRKGLDKPLEIAITRAKIDIPSIAWEMKENNIAYLNINQFGDNTESNFKKAVNEILLNKPQGLILDLRYNGGGLLESAVNILSDFLPENKKAVIIKKRKTEENEIRYTSKKPRLEDMPLVILVNEGTASAAEILAGAAQDYKRAVLIGQKTFGKGSVQEIDDLADGSSLRITIAKWFTPLDRSIDHVGLTPDIVVEKPVATTQPTDEKTDLELDRAMEYLVKGK